MNFDLERYRKDMEDFNRRFPARPGYMLCLDGTYEKVPLYQPRATPTASPSRYTSYRGKKSRAPTLELLAVIGLLAGSFVEAEKGVTTREETIRALCVLWELHRKEQGNV